MTMTGAGILFKSGKKKGDIKIPVFFSRLLSFLNYPNSEGGENINMVMNIKMDI